MFYVRDYLRDCKINVYIYIYIGIYIYLYYVRDHLRDCKCLFVHIHILCKVVPERFLSICIYKHLV